MNLDDIRERSRACEKARDDAAGLMGTHGWPLAAIASAADVPALLAEIERLRTELADEVAAHQSDLREAGAELRDLAAQLRDARFGIEEGS